MRMRVEYTIGSELRFLSNLDTMHMMERALRRAKIPFALSEGFNPHIRLSMGTVLPVGLWGMKEYFDLELASDLPPSQLGEDLNRVLPEGVKIRQAVVIPADTPSLMKAVNCASYGFVIKSDYAAVDGICQEIWQASSLPVKSRGKKKDVDKDLRKGIYKIDIQTGEGIVDLMIWVATGEPVNVRYDELMDLLNIKGVGSGVVLDVFREGNYIRDNERFYTPMEKVGREPRDYC